MTEEQRQRKNERSRQYYQENRAKCLAATSAWAKRNTERRKTHKAKFRAKPGVRAKEAEYMVRRRRNSAARFIADILRAAPCTDCNKRYPAQVMEFDHLGDKNEEISVMVGRNPKPSALFAEIAKCELVCANCHRIRTINRRLDAQPTR